MNIQLTFHDRESNPRLLGLLEQVCHTEFLTLGVERIEAVLEQSAELQDESVVCRLSLTMPQGLVACSANALSDEDAIHCAVQTAKRLSNRYSDTQNLPPVPVTFSVQSDVIR